MSLMPLAEVPSPQGPQSLGYDPSRYFTVERDFEEPDDLRELVDATRRHGLPVRLDHDQPCPLVSLRRHVSSV